MRVTDWQIEALVSGKDHPVRWEQVLALEIRDLRAAARDVIGEGEYATDEYGVPVVEKAKLDRLKALLQEKDK